MSKLFFAGGRFGAKKSFQLYNPETKEFTKCRDAPYGCGAPAVVSYGNVAYVCGGVGNMDNIMMYYQETDHWRVEKAALMHPRSHATAVVRRVWEKNNTMFTNKNKNNDSEREGQHQYHQLYVIGGQDRSGTPLSDAEIFDIREGKCSYVSSIRMPFLEGKRKNYSVIVREDKVYFLGGEDGNGDRLKTCDVFNLPKGENIPMAPMNEGRSNFSAVLYENQIIVMGGLGPMEGDPPRPAALSSVESFSFETGEWTSFPSMTRARDSHCATVCEHKIYVIGGSISGRMSAQQEDGRNTNTIEVFDPKTSTWTLHDDLSIARWNSKAVTLKRPNVLLIGGRFGIRFSVQTYNPRTGEFITCSKPPKPIGYPGCTTLGNTAFVCGGSGNSQNILMYNMETDTWTGYFNIIRTPRTNPMACIYNGELHVVSGQNFRGFGITSVEVFNISEKGLSFQQDYEMPPMIHARHDYAVVCHKNKFYLIGGEDRTDDRCKQCEMFNFDNQEKTVMGELIEGRSRFAAVMFQDNLIAIGGLGHVSGKPPRPTPLKTVESYDFKTKKWTSFPPLTRARDGHCACVYEGKIWVFGGRLTDFWHEDANTTTLEYYDPEDQTWHFKQDLPVARWCTGAVNI